MTTWYSAELTGIDSLPVVKPSSAAYSSGLYRFRAVIALATQLVNDTIVIGVIPAGYAFAFGVLCSTVSLGTSTIAIGIAGTAGKYRAAATFTAIDTPTLYGLTANLSATALTASERQIITVTTANLPASGTLVVDQYWSSINT